MNKKINAKDMMVALRKLQSLEKELSWAKAHQDTFISSKKAMETLPAEVAKAEAEFDESTAALTAAIKEAEGRSTARTVTAKEILSTLEEVEDKIGVKRAMNGTTVNWDGGQKFPSAYRAIPYSTHWTAEYRNGHWNILTIARGICPNVSTGSGRVCYSDAAKQVIIEKASTL